MDRAVGSFETWALFDVPPPEEGGVEAYLHTILRYCAELFNASVASAFLRVDLSDTYRLAAVYGTNSIRADAAIRAGEGIAGSALQLGTPILIDDPRRNPLLSGRINERRSDIASSMVVPLSIRSQTLGVLNVARGDSEPAFGPEDLQRASALAGQISLAVSNYMMIGQLKHAEEEIRTVFECIGVAVMVVDRTGIRTKNPEAETLLGLSDLEGLYLALPKGIQLAVKNAIEAGLGGENQKLRVQSQDGKTTWQVKVVAMPSGAVTVAIEDLSFAVQATQELARVKRLAEIGQMTAALAHEIRNPLTGIRSAAQFLKSAPDQAEDLGAMIEQEAIKLNGLCDEFLGFAKPAYIRPAVESLNALIRQVAEFHRSEYADKGVRLVIKDLANWNGLIDGVQIEQVVRNLFLNALQACEQGDSVVCTVHEDGFTVEDDGPGMDTETLGRLFTPFFTTKTQGTGLGLSNVQKIITAHEGQITVDSQPGTGTCFVVSLPNRVLVAA